MGKEELAPDYRGLWISDNDFRLFHMWRRKEEDTGKILEEYHGDLVEADFFDLVAEGIDFSFTKRYRNPGAGLLRGDIFYSGTNINGLISGEWEGKNIEGAKTEGLFYLSTDSESCEVLKRILGGLDFLRLEHMIANQRMQFPYDKIKP